MAAAVRSAIACDLSSFDFYFIVNEFNLVQLLQRFRLPMHGSSYSALAGWIWWCTRHPPWRKRLDVFFDGFEFNENVFER
jgi:hypothetical protein